MELNEILAIGFGVVLTAVAGAVSWLIRTVIKHSVAIAAISAATTQKDDVREKIFDMLEAQDSRLRDISGDIRTVCERTVGLQRTTDRHERFLEAGLLGREA